jgi:hypothetical protein
MAKTYGGAIWPRLACLLLSAITGRIVLGADPAPALRYVTAPGNPIVAPGDPTLAPADPTVAPADPTLAPADPRESFEPRDMTSPRAVRRALRGRARDRVAPDQPLAPPLRDLTETPVASGWPAAGRRFETLFRFLPAERGPGSGARSTERVAPAEPAVVHRVTPANPVIVSQTPPPPAPRTAPPAPLPDVEKHLIEAGPSSSPIQLTQASPDPVPIPGPTAPLVPPAPQVETLPADQPYVATLNKPIAQISLIEPIDVDGLRPADTSAELEPANPPVLLVGSLFVEAHPARYLYCFTHQPLYYEEANLERCGITYCCCQPVVSAAQFVGRTALLPYSLLDVPPCRCVRTLGDCPTCSSYPCWCDWNR